MSISHLDFLSYDTHTKLHFLSVWWSLKFLPSLHRLRNSLWQLLPEIKTVPTEITYLHPAKSLLCFVMKPCLCRTSPEDEPKVTLAVSNRNNGRHLTSAVYRVALVLMQFLHYTSEQGSMRHLMATRKHEKEDLFNFFLNCHFSNTRFIFIHL